MRESTRTGKYNVVVIGAGTAGLVTTARTRLTPLAKNIFSWLYKQARQ